MEERDLVGLAGVVDGGPDGRGPLVLLHGLTFDRAMWRPALDALGQIDPGRQVLALDLPGHGGSPAWPRYDIDSVAAAVQQAVTAARFGDPVVVGHSMAAVIATVYAAGYPVRGVVNVDQRLQVAPFLSKEDRMNAPDESQETGLSAGLSDDVTCDGMFQVVRDGYDAVYDALPRGETFNRIWRDKAYGGDLRSA